jgi:hypothetical protein
MPRERHLSIEEAILLTVALVALLAVFYGILITGTSNQHQGLRREIHDCYEQGKRAVMLTNGTIECRD